MIEEVVREQIPQPRRAPVLRSAPTSAPKTVAAGQRTLAGFFKPKN